MVTMRAADERDGRPRLVGVGHAKPSVEALLGRLRQLVGRAGRKAKQSLRSAREQRRRRATSAACGCRPTSAGTRRRRFDTGAPAAARAFGPMSTALAGATEGRDERLVASRRTRASCPSGETRNSVTQLALQVRALVAAVEVHAHERRARRPRPSRRVRAGRRGRARRRSAAPYAVAGDQRGLAAAVGGHAVDAGLARRAAARAGSCRAIFAVDDRCGRRARSTGST